MRLESNKANSKHYRRVVVLTEQDWTGDRVGRFTSFHPTTGVTLRIPLQPFDHDDPRDYAITMTNREALAFIDRLREQLETGDEMVRRWYEDERRTKRHPMRERRDLERTLDRIIEEAK